MSYAIEVKGVTKFYNGFIQEPVLNNISLKVEQGTIYCLLGPSGCGKTTLLSCIIGLKNWNKGEIKIFQKKFTPQSSNQTNYISKIIGYTPQDTALYSHLTISEQLTYYAIIYEMSGIEILQGIQEISQLLHLPYSSKLIGKLSGGEQRRVSLACALVHKPKLLILDEPTVGLDPLLRESIWNYLHDLSTKSNVTMVISTHFEEAKTCDSIGIMRFGRILAQDSPNALIQNNNAVTLEQAVLKLCQQANYDEIICHKRKNNVQENIAGESKDNSLNPSKSLSKHLHIILSLVKLNLLLIIRNPVALMFQIILPISQIFLFYFIIGRDPFGLTFSVVNLEQEESCLPFSNNNDTNFSCKFLHQFKHDDFHWKIYTSSKDALHSVQNGDSFGILTFPANFTQDLINRGVLGKFAEKNVIEGSTIKLNMDMTNYITNSFVLRIFNEKILEFLEEIILDLGGESKSLKPQLKVESVYNKDWDEGTWSDFFLPGVILFSLFMLNMMSGVCHLMEKVNGTLDRSKVAGVQMSHFLLSYLLSGSIIILFQLMTLLPLALFVFGMHSRGIFMVAFMLIYLTAVIGLLVGFIIAMLCNFVLEFMFIVMTINSVLMLNQGLIWPRESAPFALQVFCKFVPTTLASDALRSILNVGKGISLPQVYNGFLIVLGWIVFCSFVIFIINKVKRK